MVLSIYGINARNRWEGVIQRIRDLAMLLYEVEYKNKIMPDDPNKWKEWMEYCGELSNANATWIVYPMFRELLRFSDTYGLFVCDGYLGGINYKESFQLGSLNKFYLGLSFVDGMIHKHREAITEMDNYLYDSFNDLYEIVRIEHENGGVIFFG